MLERLIEALREQAEADTMASPYVDDSDPTDAILDGHFDLERIAHKLSS